MQREQLLCNGTVDCSSRCQQWANRNRCFGSAWEGAPPYKAAARLSLAKFEPAAFEAARRFLPRVGVVGSDPIAQLLRARKTTSTATLPSRPASCSANARARGQGAAGVARLPCGFFAALVGPRVLLCGQVILSDQTSSPSTNASVTITAEVWPRRAFLRSIASHRIDRLRDEPCRSETAVVIALIDCLLCSHDESAIRFATLCAVLPLRPPLPRLHQGQRCGCLVAGVP